MNEDTNVLLPKGGLRELHLFAGAGGGVLGGMLLGHTCVCAVEIEPYRRKSLIQRQRDGILPRFPIWDDVKTFDGRPWRGLVDIVCGGFPCQDISIAGKRAGINGHRSGLWAEMQRIIGEVRPDYVLVENSPMLAFLGGTRVVGDLAVLGYDCKWGVISAADAIWSFGTPIFDHLRERLFIAAANPNRVRELQSQGRERDQRGRLGYSSETTVNAYEGGLSRSESKSGESGPGGIANISPRITNAGWWNTEPRVDRVANGVAHRLDRTKAVGDGQVPAVVRLAWETLTQ